MTGYLGIVLAVACSVALGLLIAQRLRRRDRLAALPPEDRAQHDRCVAADRAVRAAQRARRRAIRQAKKRMRIAQADPATTRLDHRNYVTATRIVVNGKGYELTPDVWAELGIRGGSPRPRPRALPLSLIHI